MRSFFAFFFQAITRSQGNSGGNDTAGQQLHCVGFEFQGHSLLFSIKACWKENVLITPEAEIVHDVKHPCSFW